MSGSQQQRERFWNPEEFERKNQPVQALEPAEKKEVAYSAESDPPSLEERPDFQIKAEQVESVTVERSALEESTEPAEIEDSESHERRDRTMMLVTYDYSCTQGHRVSTYHPVTKAADIEKMCKKCNSDVFKRRRTSKGTYKNEFAFEFVVAPENAIIYDEYGSAMPVDDTKKRSRLRELVEVRKKWIGIGKTLVVKTTIDATDPEFANMCILTTYLLKHDRRVGWSDTSRNPVPARNEDGAPYTPSFEYHPESTDDYEQ